LTKYGKPIQKTEGFGSPETNKLFCHVCDETIEGFEPPYAYDHMVNHVVIKDG
jgi:hypothetical protein